jgi:hypothetical protein
MMTPQDIQMCVVDVLQDDEIEDIDSVLRMLNHAYESSWRAARGSLFTKEEVRSALEQIMAAGLVTPCAEQPPLNDCVPIPVNQVGTTFPWDVVWFHLEPSGREALGRWWETVGRAKFPLAGG